MRRHKPAATQTHCKTLLVQQLVLCATLALQPTAALTATLDAESGPGSNQAPSQTDIFELSLHDLMNIKINTISKKEEDLLVAPGIVSVITQKELNKLGVRSVSEAISHLPGIHHYESYFGAYSQFSIRGNQVTEHFNSKILMLVNGHPFFEGYSGSFEVNAIPMRLIERIELIRGPMSVFYGTNALSGVINIVTQAPTESPHTAVSVEAGSFDAITAHLSTSQQTPSWQYRFTVQAEDRGGYNYTIAPDQDERGLASEHDHYRTQKHIALELRDAHWRINALLYRGERPSNIGLIPSIVFFQDKIKTDALYFDARFQKALTDAATLTWVTRYDTWENTYFVNNSNLIENALFGTTLTDTRGRYHHHANKFGSEAYVSIEDVMNKLDVILGASFDIYHDIHNRANYIPSGARSFLGFYDEKSNRDLALYGSVDYALAEAHKLTIGVRYTHNRITGSNISYKSGLVGRLSPNTFYKLLFGTAYRSPSGVELFINAPGIIVGNTQLNPEILSGFDAQLHHAWQKHVLSTTYFYNKTRDFIARVPTATGPQYKNTDGTHSQGIELDYRYQASSAFQVFGNLTHIIENEDRLTGQDVLSPRQFINVGLSMTGFDEKITATTTTQYVSSWGAADSYSLTHFKLQYRPHRDDAHGTEFYLSANNLLDENYEWAEFARGNIKTIPGGPPLAVSIGAIWQF